MSQNNFDFSLVSASFYTPEQLQKINSVRIGIAGTGGLGSNCALALIRSGFKKFVLVDFDIVSLSNLNRQQYVSSEIGLPKVECLERMLRTINPAIECAAIQKKVDVESVTDLFENCDCIVEAFDNAECKAMIVNEFAVGPKLVVSASGIGGYGISDRIITKKIRDNFYLIGDGVSEVGANLKPYAPCVMIAAAKQADVVLNWVLEKK